MRFCFIKKVFKLKTYFLHSFIFMIFPSRLNVFLKSPHEAFWPYKRSFGHYAVTHSNASKFLKFLVHSN